MADAAIRLLTVRDLDAALALSSAAGWNQGIEDWRMLLRLAPSGAFCAIAGDGALVGTAIGIDYEAFGWIAMMLVDEAHRGRGLGGRLLEAAMDAIPGDRPIGLDATPLGRPLYQRYGFADEAMLTRHVRGEAPSAFLAGNKGRPDTPPSRAGAVEPADMRAIAAIDRGVFGAGREPLIEWIADRSPEYAFAARGTPSLVGYCFGRRGRLFDQIGPVIADEAATAIDLVGKALAASGGRQVAVDAFDGNADFAAFLAARGFVPQRPLFRMRRPPARPGVSDAPRAAPLVEFAILGPEFA